MAREFTVVSSKQGNRAVVRTNARTIAELKRDMNDCNVDYSNMQFCIRATQGKVYNDNDMLPPYDSSKPDIIILTPSKTTNGNGI